MTDLISADLVRLDADLGSDKHEVIRTLARLVADAGRSDDPDQLAADAINREGTAPTGFLGAIFGGVLAGLIGHWIAGCKVPAWARAV